MGRVIRSEHVEFYPEALCLGDGPDPDAPSNCTAMWRISRSTLDLVKAHIRSRPTHEVAVTRTVKSIYRWQD